MPVYFVLRSHYDNPAINDAQVFEQDSMLEWFRHHWNHLNDGLLKRNVYGFSSLGKAISKHSLAPPETGRELYDLLCEHLYYECDMRARDHALRVLTNDDELELAWYVFDGDYVQEFPDRAAFMIHEGWGLPENAVSPNESGFETELPVHPLSPSASSEGKVYAVLMGYEDSGSLSYLKHAPRSFVFSGLRLPEFADFLHSSVPQTGGCSEGGWPFEIKLLRSQLHGKSSPSLDLALKECAKFKVGSILNGYPVVNWGDGTPEEASRSLAQIIGTDDQNRIESEKSLFQISQHMVQASLHVDSWESSRVNFDLFHRWIFFDDLWATAHSDLAKSILAHGLYWDVPGQKH